eukprot:CAMPEP_0117491234 /NCGR_PEP_ID=MMETSP0784-20121206/17960_1 /TAXON_ID=39447 /ORGANISM="" /LENGTH=665 /DNA_ID=CAMNT_0005286015 /DNA_START=1 /DNA_END=1998 /DNA_ORIENTATION=-
MLSSRVPPLVAEAPHVGVRSPPELGSVVRVSFGAAVPLGPRTAGDSLQPTAASSAWGELKHAIAAAVGVTSCAAALRAHRRRAPSCSLHGRVTRLVRHAGGWAVAESAKEDPIEAAKDAASQVATALAAFGRPSFGLLCVPQRWASSLAKIAEQLRGDAGLPLDAPIVGLQSGGSETLRFGLACGGAAQPFFANKEDLSQAGGGLAKSASASVPGVPDGDHKSFLLFADPGVPAVLTRNLLEALDGRYPNATKSGLVVMPAKTSASQAAAAEDDDWEPPKDGSRRLRPRDRTDGHGWISGDPAFKSTDDDHVVAKHTAEFKRRPFGVKRYTPGTGGKGAMIIDMVEKARYKGDVLGQACTQGVTVGMVVKAINGTEVRDWDFEAIMEMLNDEGIMDPDSKSAAAWGDAAKGDQRKPVDPAELPVTVDFVQLSSSGGSGLAPLCLDGQTRRDGVLGLALSDGLSSVLDLCACSRLGPELRVKKAGVLPQGGFAVSTVEVGGKELPAAGALKMAGKAAGLTSMKGVCVGVPRPQAAGDGSQTLAAKWAIFPLVNVTKEGGLVLRCKGLTAEGLGADDGLEKIQLFGPADEPNVMGRLADAGKIDGYAKFGFATKPDVISGGPSGTFGVVGAAVLGAAGGSGATAAADAPTSLHRQSAMLTALVDLKP